MSIPLRKRPRETSGEALSPESFADDCLKGDHHENDDGMTADTESAIMTQMERRLRELRGLKEKKVELEERQLRSRQQEEALKELQADSISVNVGGELFSFPKELLRRSDKNSYFDLLLKLESNPAVSMRVDENGVVFIDRDPEVFRYILDYLRGYKAFNKMEGTLAKRMRLDAQFYRLPGLLKMLDEEKSQALRFRPGPGVSPEGDRMRVFFGVAIIGEESLVTGQHHICFSILADEYIGVGIVSDSCTSTDSEFHKTLHCCIYYMSGVFFSNFPAYKKEESSESIPRFGSGDIVKITLDMDKGFAEFTVKNTKKTISIGKAKRLRFAVTAKSMSGIRIIH